MRTNFIALFTAMPSKTVSNVVGSSIGETNSLDSVLANQISLLIWNISQDQQAQSLIEI